MPATGSSTVAPRRTRSALLSGAHLQVGAAHAGCPIGVALGRTVAGSWRRPLVAGGKQLVENRHAHDQAGGDLLGDQRLGRVDHLAR